MKIEKRARGIGLSLLSFLSLLSLPSFAAAKATPALPYGTYQVMGAFRGDYNTVMRDFGEAKVRAQRADGTVIAESTPGPIGVNASTFAGFAAAGIPGAVIASPDLSSAG